jgi:putative flippase GtrA
MKAGEIARYVAVGGTNALIQNAVLIVATRVGYPYLVAGAVVATLFVPLGYVAHSVLTFRAMPSLSGLVRFVGGVLAGVPLSSATLWLLHGVAAVRIEIAAPLTSLLMAGYGFIVTRLIARQSDPHRTSSATLVRQGRSRACPVILDRGMARSTSDRSSATVA